MIEEIYTKVYICGNVVESYSYDKPFIRNRHRVSGFHNNKNKKTRDCSESEKNRKDTITKASHRLRKLIFTNFMNSYTFLTLTFNSNCTFNVTSIKECNKAFEKFRKRMNRYLVKNYPKNAPFKYIGVTEFQDNNERDAIHYHLITDLPYIDTKTLQEIWSYGSIHIQKHTTPPIENRSIISYLSKGIYDLRLDGYRKYFHSYSLKKPIELIGSDAEEYLDIFKKQGYTVISSNKFESNYLGNVYFEMLKRANIKENH